MAIDGKVIAQHLRTVFGGSPKMHRYWNADETIPVHVLSSGDRPDAGITSYGTVDLSSYDNQFLSGDGKPLRVEIVGACASAVTTFANIISTAALNVATGEYSLSPGVIHPGVVAMYEPDVKMKHLLFVQPFLWGSDAFASMQDDDQVVAFLQVVPISDEEFAFARDKGVDALEDVFVEAGIDVFDLDREPVVGGGPVVPGAVVTDPDADILEEGVVTAPAAEVMRLVDDLLPLEAQAETVWLRRDGIDFALYPFGHMVPLAGSDEVDRVAALMEELDGEAVRRWGAAHRFDATANYLPDDPRFALAQIITKQGARHARWWQDEYGAVVVFDSLAQGTGEVTAALLVVHPALVTGERASAW